MNVLNLYAGLGGNRLRWPSYATVTAVEYDPRIAEAYREQHPADTLVVGDAHEYLLQNFARFDLVWSSPPCQSHSRMIRGGRNRKPRFPDLKLYEEILFLKHHAKCLWVVENVVPYYEPLIAPTARIGRHLFWSNFPITGIEEPQAFKGFVKDQTLADGERLKAWLGVQYTGTIYYGDNHCPTQVLRNCVHPSIGEQIFDAAEAAHLIGP